MSLTSLAISRLVGTQEDQVLIPTYDWQTYLSPHFKKVPNIKRFHQFKFSAKHLREVICNIGRNIGGRGGVELSHFSNWGAWPPLYKEDNYIRGWDIVSCLTAATSVFTLK